MKHVSLKSFVLSLGLTVSASAQVLLLDFGPTAPTGSETNSPFHTATGSTLSTWNVIGAADTPSLLYANGDAATGLTLDLGATSSDSSTLIDLANQPDTATNALGSQINTGVYAGNSVGKDGIFEAGTDDRRSVGFQLSGLVPGTYDVYVTTRNTNTAGVYSMTSYVAAGLSGNFDHAAYTGKTLSYAAGMTAATAAWVEEGNADENYTKFTITLGAGDVLNLAVAGGASGQIRGFLNSAAIVLIPEPAGAALLAIGLAGLCLRRKRP